MTRILPAIAPDLTLDEVIAVLEAHGFGWSLDHHGGLIEARVWDWPYCVGRYRPATVEPLAQMLHRAIQSMRPLTHTDLRSGMPYAPCP